MQKIMFQIGCHLSVSKGFGAMGNDALKIQANTFQFFTRNPRGGTAKAIDPNDIAAFIQLKQENGIGKLVAHAPYTLNACADRPDILNFSREMMADDLARLEHLPGNYYNFHPGGHGGRGVEIGVAKIAETLNLVLKPDQTTIVLLETMAGKGNEMGRSFEELRAIIDRVKLGEKVGVCLDTCHVWDAGYDIVNNLDGVLDEFDRVIGLDRLRAVHLNDSKNPCGSHKDRHETIGNGMIGLDAIARIIKHPKLRDLPFCLETPNELDGYAKEIALLKQLRNK